MPIAFDAVSAGSLVFDTTLSWFHTSSGSDLVILAGLKLFSPDDLIGITCDGVAMTHINTIQAANSTGDDEFCIVYALANPATGSNSIVATRSSAGFMIGAGSTYTGASGIPTVSATGAESAPSLTLVVPVTVSVANSWLIGFAESPIDSGTWANSGNTVVRGNASGVATAFDSDGTVGTGSQSLTFERNTLFDKAGIVAVLEPAGGGGGGDNQPIVRRFGGVPNIGGQHLSNRGMGRMWGRSREGLIVPRRLAA